MKLVFQTYDFLIEDDLLQTALGSDLCGRLLQQRLRYQDRRDQYNLPAVRLHRDLDMPDSAHPKQLLLLRRELHALHQFPEHIVLLGHKPILLHAAASRRSIC